MSDLLQIIKLDQGGANARILAKQSKADFRRVEAASLKMPFRFCSAEAKRLFVRYFSTLQLNSHFISVISRVALDHVDIGKIEAAVRLTVDALGQDLDIAHDGAQALFDAHGITLAASYDTVALEGEIGVMSSTARRYLEALAKLDALMPLLQTLEIHEVITTQAVDIQRAALKRQVRQVAQTARSLATGLRRQMNMAAARAAVARSRADAIEEGGDVAAGAVSPAADPSPSTAADGALALEPMGNPAGALQ